MIVRVSRRYNIFVKYLPKVPTGMKNDPIIPPIISINFIAQNPFCIPALGSFDDLTLIIISENSIKKRVTIKQSLKYNTVCLIQTINKLHSHYHYIKIMVRGT